MRKSATVRKRAGQGKGVVLAKSGGVRAQVLLASKGGGAMTWRRPVKRLAQSTAQVGPEASWTSDHHASPVQ